MFNLYFFNATRKTKNSLVNIKQHLRFVPKLKSRYTYIFLQKLQITFYKFYIVKWLNG